MARGLSLCFLFLLSFGSIAVSQTVTRDVTYTTDSSGTYRGDMYQPSGAGPFPAIVYVHGGAWRSGNKSSFRNLANDLARDGYVGFSINYDLHAHSFPLSWQESRAAVQFLRAHASEYRVDPARITIVGTSAGAELAALVALSPNGPAPLPNGIPSTPISVSAGIVLNGVFDLCYPRYVIKRYMGSKCAAHKDLYEEASPLRQITPSSPPFFVGHGTKDHVVPYLAADQFIAALQNDHVPVKVFRAEGGHHMYWQKKNFYQQNLSEMESFLAPIMKGAQPAAAE